MATMRKIGLLLGLVVVAWLVVGIASGAVPVAAWARPERPADAPGAALSEPAAPALQVYSYSVYLPVVIKYWPPPPPEFYSARDTMVASGYAATNFGADSAMWAGYDDYFAPPVKTVRSLVAFDLSRIPAGTAIGQATLQLYHGASYDYPGKARTITTYRVSAAWTEMGVTWNTKPGYAEAYGSASIVHGAWGWYSFDVTNLVRAWVNGTYPNHGLMVRGPESSSDPNWRAFGTREFAGCEPRLVIAYGTSAAGAIESPPPEVEADFASLTGVVGQVGAVPAGTGEKTILIKSEELQYAVGGERPVSCGAARAFVLGCHASVHPATRAS